MGLGDEYFTNNNEFIFLMKDLDVLRSGDIKVMKVNSDITSLRDIKHIMNGYKI